MEFAFDDDALVRSIKQEPNKDSDNRQSLTSFTSITIILAYDDPKIGNRYIQLIRIYLMAGMGEKHVREKDSPPRLRPINRTTHRHNKRFWTKTHEGDNGE